MQTDTNQFALSTIIYTCKFFQPKYGKFQIWFILFVFHHYLSYEDFLAIRSHAGTMEGEELCRLIQI